MIIETNSEKETFELGKKIGENAKAGQIYTLTGDLGVGKTVFTQGLAAGLGITEPVNSPTFTIVQMYEDGRLPFYHFDVYRIGDIEEMEEIEDIVKVYHAGAKKYGPNNWQNLDNGFERYRAAAARHIMAYLKGERMDKETNVHHLAAAAWNVITMLWYDKHGKGLI